MSTDLVGLGEITKELREFVGNLIGPSSRELGEIFADKLRYLRLKNAERILIKTKHLLQNHNIEPKAVNLKFFFPFLEGCSLEEEEDLITKWVSLLAMAASGEIVRTVYPKILSEMDPFEARILDYLYDQFLIAGNRGPFDHDDLRNKLPTNDDDFNVSVENLIRLGVCQPEGFRKPKEGLYFRYIWLTTLGCDFVRACRGPEPKDSEK